MNKIYLSGNYIIVEGLKSHPIPFPRVKSEYNEHIDHFILRRFPNKDIIHIPFSEIDNSEWLQADGLTAYTVSGLREFLRLNTDFSGALGGAIQITQAVGTYNDLDSTQSIQGDIAYVYNSQGTKWLPGSIGGTYYPAGWYSFDGLDWVSDRNAIANQFELNQVQLDNKSNIGHTHVASDILRDSFERFVHYLKSTDPTPTFTYGAGNRLDSISYLWIGNTTTLTMSYGTGNRLEQISLSGVVENNIPINKNLIYSGNNLISINYS